MYGQDILSGISKYTLQNILYKISYSYIERHDFKTELKWIVYLRSRKCFEMPPEAIMATRW